MTLDDRMSPADRFAILGTFLGGVALVTILALYGNWARARRQGLQAATATQPREPNVGGTG